MNSQRNSLTIPFIVILTLLLALLGYLFYENRTQDQKITMLLEERNYFLLENSSSTKTLASERALASSTIADLTEQLERTTEDLEDTERDLEREENRNEEFEDQINAISGTVGILDKLSKTDEELLQKYSRTYFLNENFVPMKLAKIETKYILPGRKEQYFHGNAVNFLNDMLDDAEDDGFELKVLSAYRSFDEQQALKGQYTQVYGSGANAFSADQGYSEHQLGTTVDLSDLGTAGAFTSFAQTKEYTWLLENAHKYGFVLSYPQDNSFFVFEPWHWRFVGIDLATDLHRQNADFYTWDQRKIDEYLVKIFD
jgi:LAS superfamily LD-carboxypeptidase LdcB